MEEGRMKWFDSWCTPLYESKDGRSTPAGVYNPARQPVFMSIHPTHDFMLYKMVRKDLFRVSLFFCKGFHSLNKRTTPKNGTLPLSYTFPISSTINLF